MRNADATRLLIVFVSHDLETNFQVLRIMSNVSNDNKTPQVLASFKVTIQMMITLNAILSSYVQ